MRFCISSFAALAIASLSDVVSGKIVKEVRGFLSQDEIDNLIREGHANVPDAEEREAELAKFARYYTQATLGSYQVERYRCAVSDSMAPSDEQDCDEDVPVVLRTLAESTEIHQDRHTLREGLPQVEELVSIITLNDNPNATFIHDEEHVAVEAGKMLLFRADDPHYTRIDSGIVEIVGAFTASSFEAVNIEKSCFTDCDTDEDCQTGCSCYGHTPVCETRANAGGGGGGGRSLDEIFQNAPPSALRTYKNLKGSQRSLQAGRCSLRPEKGKEAACRLPQDPMRRGCGL